MHFTHRFGQMSFGVLLLTMTACNNQVPPVASASSSPPAASPTPAASPAPAASMVPAVAFRDDFDGSTIDPTKWKAFERNGLFLLRDGRLEMLCGGNQTNFPYLLSQHAVIPESGPFYFELKYEYLALATGIANFSLDFLPPETPDEEPLTVPFIRWSGYFSDLRTTIKTGNTDVKNGVAVGTAHVLRLENDGSTHYRSFLDGQEIVAFDSTRRPTRFWVGSFPVKGMTAPISWPRLALDYVAAGVLDAPTPPATPSPSPSPSSSPS